MAYSFGQDVVYYFYPLIDDEPAVVAAALQTQTPAIYVFTDSPSRTVAAAGTGAQQSITSWTWSAERNAWSFTITAIEDPDPTGGTSVRTYYVAINFLLKTAGQVQTVIRSLDLERVRGHHRSVTVMPNDLADYFPQIDAYSTLSQRQAYIAQAVEEVRAKLKASGYEWSRIHRADRLNMVVTLKALAMIMLAQLQTDGDKFAVKYAEFKKSYETMLESLQFEYDSNDDGVADVITATTTDLWVVR